VRCREYLRMGRRKVELCAHGNAVVKDNVEAVTTCTVRPPVCLRGSVGSNSSHEPMDFRLLVPLSP